MITEMPDVLEPHVVLEAYVVVLKIHALLSILTPFKLDFNEASLDLSVRVFLIVEALATKIGV